jgi:integrase
MKGHIRQRSPGHWAIVLDLHDRSGRRRRKWHSFRGTKREAERECARLITEMADQVYVERDRKSLNQFLDAWETDWVPVNVSPRTAERYSELLRLYVRPRLGDKPLQAIRPEDLNGLCADLHHRLAPLSVRQVYRLLHRIFGHALKWGAVKRNVVSLVDSPKVPHSEAAALLTSEVPQMFAALRGTPLFSVAVVALGTGLRRGELLALRWQDADLDAGVLRVERSLEQTRKGLRFKSPKSARSRRNVTLAPAVVAELRNCWKAALELRLALGQGRPPSDALVFCGWDGTPIRPTSLSDRFGIAMKKAGLPRITLHSLRHTHASQLIASGMDVVTVSRRLGHASAAITLNTYSHLITPTDRAAEIVQSALVSAGIDGQ